MKSLLTTILFISTLVLSFSNQAQQLNFDFGHSDEVLEEDFYPGDADVKVVSLKEMPQAVQDEIVHVDTAFELADGYYDYLSHAYYSISFEGKVIGYMDCAVLSYTEDPGLYLTGVKFNLQGRRITGHSYDDLILNFFESEEEVKEYLPAELHPKEED